MHKFYILLFFLGILINLFQLSAQTPDTTYVYQVSVNPNTGNDEIIWYSNPSPGIDYYIIGYSVYSNPNDPYLILPIDTVPATDTIYINTNTTSNLHSVGYNVYAVNVGFPQGFYHWPDSTVFLETRFDSCTNEIQFNWNSYNRWKGQIKNFTLYRRTAMGDSFVQDFPEGTNTFTLNTAAINQDLYYYINVEHIDNERNSYSNVSHVSTYKPIEPSYINANSALPISDNQLRISFSSDPLSEIRSYLLLRSSSLLGPYDTINNNVTALTRNFSISDEINTTEVVYYYKIAALNQCGNTVIYSNVINNILLTGENENMNIQLNWNNLPDVNGTATFQLVIQQEGIPDRIIDCGSNTSYTHVLDDTLTSAEICYQVLSYENGNPYKSETIEGYSNEFCISLTPDIQFPNAFIPNNSQGTDNTFGPITMIPPEKFELMIYNRWGNLVWKGNESWDGTINGKLVDEGVYMFHLKAYYDNGRVFQKTGQVSVIHQ